MKLTIGIAKRLLDNYCIDLIDCKPNGGLSLVLTDAQARLRVVYECKSTTLCFKEYVDNLDANTLVEALQEFEGLMKAFYPSTESQEQDEDWKAIDEAVAKEEQSHFCWDKLFELVGMSGQSWDAVQSLTLRELQQVVTGRDRQLWNIGSNILVAIVNTHADKQHQISVEDVNPYAKPKLLSKGDL